MNQNFNRSSASSWAPFLSLMWYSTALVANSLALELDLVDPYLGGFLAGLVLYRPIAHHIRKVGPLRLPRLLVTIIVMSILCHGSMYLLSQVLGPVSDNFLLFVLMFPMIVILVTAGGYRVFFQSMLK